MTLYAASNSMWVGVSLAHGGCGTGHGRPVVGGAPVKVWALDCPKCERHLVSDPLWSATISEIPETHDEQIQREDREKRGSKDQEKIAGDALSEIAKMPGALEKLTAFLAAGQAGSGETVRCASGHPNAVTAKFCGECAAPMGSLAAAAPARPAAAPSAPKRDGRSSSNGNGRKKPLKDWRAEDLRAEAGRLGVSADGDRAALIGRIRAARQAA